MYAVYFKDSTLLKLTEMLGHVRIGFEAVAGALDLLARQKPYS